ncbi:MAG: TraR/DksA family transcriptional regulator [Treponema sp.]|nr:TraR/DksA family transcriptional regulator [Treponema sp.]
MKKEFIEKMQKKLEEQRDQIMQSLINQGDELKKLVVNEGSGDEADIGNGAVDINILDSLGSQDSQRLELINNALNRISQGTYGVCLSCHKDIPQNRLEAIPYAFLCVDCKAKAERRGR